MTNKCINLSDIEEIYETNSKLEANDYIQKLKWILLQTGTRFNEENKSLTIYYSLGKPKGVSNERW